MLQNLSHTTFAILLFLDGSVWPFAHPAPDEAAHQAPDEGPYEIPNTGPDEIPNESLPQRDEEQEGLRDDAVRGKEGATWECSRCRGVCDCSSYILHWCRRSI